MFDQSLLLFFILLILILGAVIAFAYFVIKPVQTRWAVRRARKIESLWQFKNVFRILATAHHDLEAAYLWQKLQQLKEKLELE